MSNKFTIGCDPEFFLACNGALASAHNIVPGNKKHPHKLPDGSHIQADGVAVEFNIEPCETGKEFSERVQSALNEVRKIIPAKYSFVYRSQVVFPTVTWKDIPDYAKELGCDPDYTADIEKSFQNKIPNDIGSIRTASGHIHIGWTDKADTTFGSDHFNDCVSLITNMDAYYSTVKTHLDGYYFLREKYYGARLAFRPKPYGVEYRTPSNSWLGHTPKYEKIAKNFLTTAKLSVDGVNLQNIIYTLVHDYKKYGLERIF